MQYPGIFRNYPSLSERYQWDVIRNKVYNEGWKRMRTIEKAKEEQKQMAQKKGKKVFADELFHWLSTSISFFKTSMKIVHDVLSAAETFFSSAFPVSERFISSTGTAG